MKFNPNNNNKGGVGGTETQIIIILSCTLRLYSCNWTKLLFLCHMWLCSDVRVPQSDIVGHLRGLSDRDSRTMFDRHDVKQSGLVSCYVMLVLQSGWWCN